VRTEAEIRKWLAKLDDKRIDYKLPYQDHISAGIRAGMLRWVLDDKTGDRRVDNGIRDVPH
jgi:hypothetical protein